jgi:hypothetical protein
VQLHGNHTTRNTFVNCAHGKAKSQKYQPKVSSPSVYQDQRGLQKKRERRRRRSSLVFLDTPLRKKCNSSLKYAVNEKPVLYTFMRGFTTISTEKSPSWEAKSSSAGQEISCILRTHKVYYHIHNSQPLVPILIQTNPVQNSSPYFSNKHSNINSHLRLDLPNGLFPSDFLTKTLYPFLISLMRPTRPAHLVLLDLITLIMWSS